MYLARGAEPSDPLARQVVNAPNPSLRKALVTALCDAARAIEPPDGAISCPHGSAEYLHRDLHRQLSRRLAESTRPRSCAQSAVYTRVVVGQTIWVRAVHLTRRHRRGEKR